VVSGSYYGTVRVWDVESGKTVLAFNTRFGSLKAVIYSPDETMIATAGEEFIKIWDAKTGEFVAVLKGHTNRANCLAWTADGMILMSGSSDCSIRTWNTITWQQTAVLTGHTNTVTDIAISPDGHILASVSEDHTAQLWNLENGQSIGSPLKHADSVSCVSFSRDGRLLATGSLDKNAYSWDISKSVIATKVTINELPLNSNVKGPFLISLPTQYAIPGRQHVIACRFVY
jgi:WD40 repeat protein